MWDGDGFFRYTQQLYATLKYCFVAGAHPVCSQYRALAPLGAVPQINVTPNYWRIPLVVIKCRYRPNF